MTVLTIYASSNSHHIISEVYSFTIIDEVIKYWSLYYYFLVNVTKNSSLSTGKKDNTSHETKIASKCRCSVTQTSIFLRCLRHIIKTENLLA